MLRCLLLMYAPGGGGLKDEAEDLAEGALRVDSRNAGMDGEGRMLRSTSSDKSSQLEFEFWGS